ncbi:MAG: flagellar biosynthesis anti-sigma factor FlgM [Burkholderiales bacterium]
MKIGNTAATAGIAPVGTAATGGREGTGKAGNAAASESESSTVKLSSAASALFEGSVDGSFDADKVSRIKQSISDGTYKIDAGAIADKLIANAQELLGKVQGS